MTKPATLFDKIWDSHLVTRLHDGRELVFVDRHVLQETTSAQAFDGLRRNRRKIAYPELNFATQDHILSTEPGRTENTFAPGRELLSLMRKNAEEHGVRLFAAGSARQGIVHVISPELGIAYPGCLLACGDSHTSTVGGVGALGIGVGTSEVEHILATQTLALRKPKTMRIWFENQLGFGVTAKDLILYTIGQHGIGMGTGHAVEYAGPTIRAMSIEARLTVCNLSIELGARLGVAGPDEKTFAYLENRAFAPNQADWAEAVTHWSSLATEEDAVFDAEYSIDSSRVAPQVTWGTTQEDVVAVDQPLPMPSQFASASRREQAGEALTYMDLEAGRPIEGLPIDVAFIGSCTNGRLSDLESAAAVLRTIGGRVPDNLRALVVPGSVAVKRAAEELGLDKVFLAAGFEWREPGCSMCLSINGDVVKPGQRCLSTSNRNFVGRQGPGSRTHLTSPAMVAAGALAGSIVDVRKAAR